MHRPRPRGGSPDCVPRTGLPDWQHSARRLVAALAEICWSGYRQLAGTSANHVQSLTDVRVLMRGVTIPRLRDAACDFEADAFVRTVTRAIRSVLPDAELLKDQAGLPPLRSKC